MASKITTNVRKGVSCLACLFPFIVFKAFIECMKCYKAEKKRGIENSTLCGSVRIVKLHYWLSYVFSIYAMAITFSDILKTGSSLLGVQYIIILSILCNLTYWVGFIFDILPYLNENGKVGDVWDYILPSFLPCFFGVLTIAATFVTLIMVIMRGILNLVIITAV